MDQDPISTRCCIVGGGPAGVMLGLLLARAGVRVVVLEKHADFFRDFRGDTIHPSTLEVMDELGLLEDFLQRPHHKAHQLQGWIGEEIVTVADFSHLPTKCKFIVFMPQWHFLDFLCSHAKRYPTFHLYMEAEVTGLIEEGERVKGVHVRTPSRAVDIHADLVVGADGRHSMMRGQRGFEVIDLGAPMDVLWMRFTQLPSDPKSSLGRFADGQIMVMIDRGDYWQCAFLIPKGTFGDLRNKGLPEFRDDVRRLAPFLGDRVSELTDWKDIQLLTVAVDRLRRWYRPGLLCIGDAAHAMSPIGGVGINLAIQDAVAAANLLAKALREGSLTLDHLRAVQRRRELPTRLTQRMQVLIQTRGIGRVLGRRGTPSLSVPIRLLRDWPILRRVPARVIGMGIRPEHIGR